VDEVKDLNIARQGGGTLAGRVVDERARFVEGARVRVGHLPADRAARGRLNAWEVDRYLDPRVYFTDADGKFLVTGIPPGITLVKAEKDGYVTFYKRDVVIESDQTRENYTITLDRGDVMEGTVKGTDGRPIRGAMVAVTKNENPGQPTPTEASGETEPDSSIEPRLSARSDEDGKFRIENVPPGTYNVVVWFAPGYQGWSRGRNEKAMRRGMASSSKSVGFKLEPTASGSGPIGPGGGNRGGGNRGGGNRGGGNRGGGNRGGGNR
ncbi:MAG: carboxypeptidase-like regulatory domain-containing protein, partial [Planctomycetota bacterium]